MHATRRHRQVVAREAGLLGGVAVLALLLQIGGHQISVIMLDVALIASGLVGLLTAIMIAGKADRWWFIGLAATAMVAGLAQLLWSSGLATGLLALIAIPAVLDALANLVILAFHFWRSSGHKV